MKGVTDQRWQDAQQAERRFWSTSGFDLEAFRRTVVPSMQTAGWTLPHLKLPGGDWLEIGVGPLGVGCTHFLPCGGDLHTLDPIEPLAADEWQLPEPCKALARSCQEATTATHVGQAERVDFADNSFSLVALHNMLDHVQDPQAVLLEARRVLKPGGQLLVAIDTFSTFGEAKFRLITRRQRSETILVRAHPHRFSSRAFLQLIAEAGFHIAQADIPGSMASIAGRSYRVRLLAT